MGVVYNVRGFVECALGFLVGLAIHALTGSGLWAGAGGCFAAAAADIAWRIKDRTDDDMMQAERGGMLYHLPVWLIGVSVGVVVLIVGYVFPLLGSEGGDVRVTSADDVGEIDNGTGTDSDEQGATAELEPGPLGELVVIAYATPKTVEISRWWRPIDILGNDRVTVELVDLGAPPSVSPADAFGVCASDPDTATFDADAIADKYQRDKPLFVVTRPDCDDLEPGTTLACTATQCSRID